MGIFDDAVPGGNITKPILIALGALLAGRMLSGGSKEGDEQQEAPVDRQVPPPKGEAGDEQVAQRTQPQAEPESDGGLLGGGLGDLLERLSRQGKGETVDSWVGKGENKPVEPQDLGKAIGDKMLGELSRRTGIPQDQLLEQLSKLLPGVVDKLTPEGKVPPAEQVAGQLKNNPW